jgi:mono/diheme cytochrome c family protein
MTERCVTTPGIALLVAGLFVVGVEGARPDPAPPPGESLYRRYCAACHGGSGRGDGPAAGGLCPPPPDLTRVRSGIPELMRQIDGRRTIRAHGSAAMPVWGEVFEQSLISEPHRRRTALHQLQTLADHVHRLQRAGPKE